MYRFIGIPYTLLCFGLLREETEAIDIEGVLPFEHVRGIRQVETRTRYFCRGVIHEPMEDLKLFLARAEIDGIAAHLRRTVGILSFLTFMNDKTAHGFSERLFHSVVVEDRLHHEKRLPRPAL